MRPFSKLFYSDFSIPSKLLFLNLMIFIVFGIITGVMFLAFHNIENLTTHVIDKNVSHVILNAQSGRELSGVFDKTHLLISTFYENGDKWKAEGDLLLSKISHLLSQSVNENLIIALRDFHPKLEHLLDQCLVINTISEDIRTINETLTRHFEKLEEIVSENMVLAAMKEADMSALEQISALIPSYKETLLKATFQFVSLEPLRSDARDAEPILVLLDELSLRVRTFLAYDPQIADYGHKVIDGTLAYKDALINFNHALIVFREQLAELNLAKQCAAQAMKQVDKDILDTFEFMRNKTTKVMQSSIRFVYVLSGVVIVLFGIFTYVFFLLNIRKPMELICEVLEAIGDGDMDARIRLGRKDEWSVIENALNKMVSEVWNSYAELYRKNEELQRMHMELEASMTHLENEVSERRQAEEALQKTQAYIKNIIDSMPSVMIGVDPQGRVTHWNMVAEKLVGINARDTRGKLLTDVYPDMAPQMNQILSSLVDHKPQKTEKQIRYRQNDVRYEDIMIYPLVGNGVEGAVIRIDDVTSRVRIEEMMIQTEKMMSVGGLAAGMAHEINNPLGIILQGIQNAFRRLSPELEVNIKAANACGTNLETIQAYLEQRGILRYLNGIRDAGNRAARIVTNMLNFSRSSDSNKVPADMNKLIDDTVELAANDYDLKKKYDFRHIEIIRDYAPDLTQVSCSPTEIEQVILNLLKNAAQAMGETKEDARSPDIVLDHVRTRSDNNGAKPRIILQTRKKDNHVIIEIKDNGPGMDRKTCKRIFEPFYTTKSVGVGTGMGLSVSYFIITNNHKGSMSVESDPGKGSKFIIHLPLEKN